MKERTWSRRLDGFEEGDLKKEAVRQACLMDAET